MSEMEEKHLSLTGRWTGVYDYPDNFDQAVPFEANIIETNGSLSGEVTEPNTFAQTSSQNLGASIDGSRSGQNVTFVKEYFETDPDVHYFIKYEGTANESLTKITGQWTTIDEFSWSGPFVMNRASASKQAEHQKESNEISV